jgi:hypothetical protein
LIRHPFLHIFRTLSALVLFCFAVEAIAGIARTYYIAEEETLWDYAPSYPINPMHQGEFSANENVFIVALLDREFYTPDFASCDQPNFNDLVIKH